MRRWQRKHWSWLFVVCCLTVLPSESFAQSPRTVFLQHVTQAQASGSLRQPTPRIIGGIPVLQGEFPWAAALVVSGADAFDGQFCGGALINRSFVATAAHCVFGSSASSVDVVLGRRDLRTEEGERIAVQRIIVHPAYNSITDDSDLALLELSRPSAQESIPLVSPEIAGLLLPGVESTVAGYGSTFFSEGSGSSNPSPFLLKVDVPVVAQSTCNDAYDDTITSNMICAGEEGKDSCQGDSGGPLVFTKDDVSYLIGVVSFGTGCALPGFPGVYTRVSAFTDWIQQNAAGGLENPAHFFWNGALEMDNIVALYNKQSSNARVVAKLLDQNGLEKSSVVFMLGGHAEIDLLVNALSGFSRTGYGTVKLDFGQGNIDANGMQYRFEAGSTELEFMRGKGLPNSFQGDSFVLFNTYRGNPSNTASVTENWLELGNRSTTDEKSYVVERYSDQGALLTLDAVRVPPQGRRDIAAGHLLPGPDKVGMLHIVPVDESSPYTAVLSRYGVSGTRTGTRINVPYASQVEVVKKSLDILYAPISAGADGQNWLVVGNASPFAGNFRVEFIENSGMQRGLVDIRLNGFAQLHFLASALLSPGSSGIAKITPLSDSAAIAESSVYFSAPGVPTVITSSYVSAGRPRRAAQSTSSYNTFVAQFDWLKLFNVGTEFVSTDVSVVSSTLLPGSTPAQPTSSTVAMYPGSGVEFGLHEIPFSVAPNTAGPVQVNDEGGVLIGELLRVQPSSTGHGIAAAESFRLR